MLKKIGFVLRLIYLGMVFLNLGGIAQAEDWKGKPSSSEMSFGALTGVGISNYTTGFAVLGTFSKKIVKAGFIPDLNNSVSIEFGAGPVLMSGTPWLYSASLRWDFIKDSDWTLFSVGGVGGAIQIGSLNPPGFFLAPRFGVGAFYRVSETVLLRGDVSHDLIAAGINLPF